MITLELPKTIHIPTLEEIPNNPDIINKINECQNANIVEGYTFNDNDSEFNTFKFYCEINIDNSRLWTLLEALIIKTMPENICLLFGHIDDEVQFSNYSDKYSVLNQIKKYENELSLDGFLEFGVLYNDENILNEIFIKKSKYIQYWGTDKNLFEDVMKDFSLVKIDNLNFVDEFPLVTESLSLHDPDALSTKEIIEELQKLK